jgi:hypothetical protein
MTSLKILQYNTDNLRHGWDYFVKNTTDVDYVILQRFPKNKRIGLCELLDNGKVFMVESSPPNNLCLAIGRHNSATQFSGTESITLPSAQHVMALDDEWQGCTALKTVVSGINLVSFLPCFEAQGGEYPIVFSETKSDILFLLNKFKDEPTVIMGDFHVDNTDSRINHLIKNAGFTSYLDNYKTFRSTSGDGDFFNLDKCISNIPIKLANVRISDVEDGMGHMAIRYTLEIDK